MLGRAQVNNIVSGVNTGEGVIEGFPSNTSLATFGGGTSPNNSDNSGILRYVSIRFGGFEFAPNEEINGLTLGGVGSGTIIENVEVFSNSDDGVEFFGGTVNTKNIAVAFCHDESFDIDQGHSGFHQFWFSIQNDDPELRRLRWRVGWRQGQQHQPRAVRDHEDLQHDDAWNRCNGRWQCRMTEST